MAKITVVRNGNEVEKEVPSQSCTCEGCQSVVYSRYCNNFYMMLPERNKRLSVCKNRTSE